jgi:hypothetical protein
VAELPPELVRRLTLSIANVAELIDASCLVVFGPDAAGVRYDGRKTKDDSAPNDVFVILAGTRAILTAIFPRKLPDWIPAVKRLRNGAANLLDQETLVVPDPNVAVADQKPAALAALIDYIALVVDAHVALHPEDEAVLPVLTDEMIDHLFKD